MDTRQIRAFLATVDTGSVTRAAELLHVVQPAISRQIKLLEEDVGTRLFERSRSGMALTEAGEVLVEYSRRALRELDKARMEIHPTSAPLAGMVHLGLLPSSCELLAANLVQAVALRYAGLQVSLSVGYTDHLAAWLEAGELDLALLYNAEQLTHLTLEPLLKEQLCLAAPAAQGLSLERPVTVAALGERPLILPSRTHSLRGLVEHACAVAKVPFRLAAETNALSVQRDLVVRGLGWSVLPAVAIRSELEQGTLSAAPVARPEFARTISLALPTTRRTSTAVRCVAEELKTRIAGAVFSGEWIGAQWLPERPAQ